MSAITMYTTPTCGYCHMAKNYFKMLKLDVITKDITKDEEAMKEIEEKTDQFSVPVIDIDGRVVVGFNRPIIDIVLREKKLL